MRRSLINFGIVLFWSPRECADMSAPLGFRKAEFSFVLAGTGTTVDVFSLSRAVDGGDGSLVTAGTVMVLLIVIVVVVEPHELLVRVAGIVAPCSRLAVLADPAILVAGTPGAGTRSVWPICKLYQFTPGLKASSSANVMPYAAAIALPVSPATTVYIRAPVLASSQGILRTWPICRLFHWTPGFMKASCMKSMLRRCAMPLPVSPACTVHVLARLTKVWARSCLLRASCGANASGPTVALTTLAILAEGSRKCRAWLTGFAIVCVHSDSRQYCALLAQGKTIRCFGLQAQLMLGNFVLSLCRGLSTIQLRSLVQYALPSAQGMGFLCMYSSESWAVLLLSATQGALRARMSSILHERNDQRALRIFQDGCAIFSLTPSYDNSTQSPLVLLDATPLSAVPFEDENSFSQSSVVKDSGGAVPYRTSSALVMMGLDG